MSKGGNRVQETPQQRALTDYAVNQLQDYKKRWLPVQMQLASQIQEMGKPGSAEQKGAEGRAGLDATMRFAQVEGALSKTLANKGVNVGSSRSKLATTGMGEDEAKTKGLGMTIADQQIQDAYTRGLSAITAIGQGERANVSSGLAEQANSSARTAEASAEASAIERAGQYQLGGQLAGFGVQQALKPAGGPMVYPDGMAINNTGTSLPTAGGS